MTVQLQSGTPLAEQLSAAVQQKIVEIGWSSDGEDASPLSEYIVLMLVNGKTESQITSELSGDLLGLGPEDESVKVFINWMFAELERLSKELGGGSTSATGSGGLPTGPAENGQAPDSTSRPDEEMAEDGHENIGLDGIPTGPKAMRNQKTRRPGGIYNQIQRTMDRANDPLRRVQNNRGNDPSRIQKHDPLRGPRQGFPTGPMAMNQRHMGRGQHPPHMQSTYMNAAGMNQGFGPMMMSPEQQFQFLQMMEQQARMMGMMAPGGFMPPMDPAQPGRSLFDRVDNGPKAGANNPPNGTNNHNQNHNNHHQHQKPRQQAGGDMDMDDGTETGTDGDAQGQEDVACKFGLRCTKADCPFAHQSPASDPSRPVAFVAGEKCTFGLNCKNKKCTSSHPSPASAGGTAAPKPTYEQQDCKFWPNCKNPHCPFKHPTNSTMPPCRFGSACTKPNCAFAHAPQTLDVPCKFKPCLNPHCQYKHEDGQQQGIFENKTWTPGKPHMSDRRFVTYDGEDEELIIPGQPPSSSGTNTASAAAIAAGGDHDIDL
ncbi:hypothetical protein ABW21_db0202143 [Orbilia brochopaga]|nr:hypothetical protein ABW21_db0202143 [Drechslerella brochopaga]